jgi:ribosomal protein S18 acetylase RimI-like enzyme
MLSQYTLSPAQPTDAPAIANIYGQSWVSPFTQLKWGRVSPATLAALMVPRIEREMNGPHTQWMVMRCAAPDGEKEEEVAAVATWTVPHDEVVEESAEDRVERLEFEDELYRKALPDVCNKDLSVEFRSGLRKLRRDTLQGRRYFGKSFPSSPSTHFTSPLTHSLTALDNIATHPAHRGKGLASQLITWGTSQADAQNVVVYLDTASYNPAKRIYAKLGFEEQGNSSKIEDLGKFGGEGSHTQVAFVRYPKGRN